MIIAITGTPGTGKTYLARSLQQRFPHQVQVIEANKLLVRKKLTLRYDRKAKTYDVDPEVVKRYLLAEISQFKNKIKKKGKRGRCAFEDRFEHLFVRLSKEDSLFFPNFRTIVEKDPLLKRLSRDQAEQRCVLLIDSHLSHLLPSKATDWCIVTKTALKTLKSRLEGRKYPLSKVQDNLEAEAFESSQMEAQELKHRILCVQTHKKS